MNAKALIFTAGLATGLALTWASTAHAQDKPAPALVQVDEDPLPDYQAWANAYVQAGEPEVAVIAFEAASQLDPITLESLARTISSDSIPAKLRAAIMQELQTPPADVQVVDTEFALQAAKRLGATLRQADDPDALRLLGREMNAQLFIQTRLVRSQRAGSPFSVLFEATNGVTGRSILNFQFDWKGGTDARTINRMARQIVRKFVETYVQRATNPARYTVRLFGLATPQESAAARKALMRVDGVTSVLTREENNVVDPWGGSAIASLTRFELRLAPGSDADATALLGAIADELGSELAARVETMQSGQGAVAVRVTDIGLVQPTAQPVFQRGSQTVNQPASVQVDTTVTTKVGTTTATQVSSSTLQVDLNDPQWREKLEAALKARSEQPAEHLEQLKEIQASPQAQPTSGSAPAPAPVLQRPAGVIDPRVAARGARQMVSSTSAGRQLREQWLSSYQAKGQPRMLVLVNRATSPREPQATQQQATSVGTQVVVSSTGLGTSNAAAVGGTGTLAGDERIPLFEQPEQLAFQARALEGRIGALLSSELLGASKIIDAEAAKGQVAADLQQRATMGEAELMTLLKQRDIADIVVLGFGRVVAPGVALPKDDIGWADDEAQPRAGNVVVYTFKAIDLRDNSVLGFADATGLDDSFTTDGLSDLSTRVVGKLAYDMLQQWK